MFNGFSHKNLFVRRLALITLIVVSAFLTLGLRTVHATVPPPVPPYHFDILDQPSFSTAAGSDLFLDVQIVDQNFAPVTNEDGVNVHVSLNNANGVTLDGSVDRNPFQGEAKFYDLSVTKSGTYTLTVSATFPDLPANEQSVSITTNSFTITPLAVAHLSFPSDPKDTQAGTTIDTTAGSGVKVLAQDQYYNPVADGQSITVHISDDAGNPPANPNKIALNGTLTQTTLNGVATFSDLSINTAGNYKLYASYNDAYVIASTSSTFNITAGPVTTLSYDRQPYSTGAGTNLYVRVLAQDTYGNVATDGTSVGMSLDVYDNPGNPTLLGTTTETTSGGIATFSELHINIPGNNYTLTAAVSVGGSASKTSPTFSIYYATPYKFVFVQKPTNTPAGAVISPAITLQEEDNLNNVLSSTATSGDAVTLQFKNNAGGGTLSGKLLQRFINGIVTFNDISIDKSATGYTLTAFGNGLGVDSDTFDILPGPAVGGTWSIEPTDTQAGANINNSGGVQVTLKDAGGVTVTSDNTTSVTLSIVGSPVGVTLGGNLTKTVTAGVATFTGLNITTAGNYQLRATFTTASATQVTFDSTSFNINPASAAKLAFFQQPSNTAAKQTITPPIRVAVEDTYGNPINDTGTSIGLVINDNPGGGTLTGSASASTSNGNAAFSGLSINKAGTGYTLKASSSGLTDAISATFNIAPGAATQMSFTLEPSDPTTAGALLAAGNVQVTLKDGGDNIVTNNSTSTVTLSITGATLNGTATKQLVAGVATITDLTITKAGNYMLHATTTAGSFTADTDPFKIGPDVANKVGFGTEPTNSTGGSAIPTFTAAIEDQYSNVETLNSGTAITLAIGTNAGPGGVLSGTTSANTSAGVATFNGAIIDKLGTGYTLVASSNGLTAGTSTAFNVNVGAAAKLGFRQQPPNTIVTQTMSPAVTVAVEDAGGNTVTSDNATTVTLTIGNNPGGTLGGGAGQAASAGIATFSGLTINKVGTGYTLQASASVTGATSNPFDITGTAPSITSANLVPQQVCEGTNVSFSASASGVPSPTVQWQENNSDIGGATNTTYSFSAAAAQTGHTFHAVFTNAVSSATTNDATLTVFTMPSAGTNPTPQSVVAGNSVSFTATGIGSVRWQVNTGSGYTDVPGAIGTTLTFNAAYSQNGYLYRAVFSNGPCTEAPTTGALLTVTGVPPAILNPQPANQTVCVGSAASFTASGSGIPAPTVQWQLSTGAAFSNIGGATNTTYTTPATTVGDNGHKFHAVFTNAISSATTNDATLTVNTAPSITGQPGNKSAVLGAQVTFTASASNSTGVQWMESSGGAFSPIGGATSATYTFTPTLAQNGHRFEAVFSNTFGCGSSTTSAATLTVIQVTVTTASLSGGTVGVAYNQTLTASGGVGSYHFAKTVGNLPPGLTLNPNGQITGSPTGGGTFSFSVAATDGSPAPGPFTGPAKALTIVIAPPTITLSPSKLNTMKAGVAFSQNVTASGGTAPLTFRLTGTLPTGITFNGATGLISGTPTAVGAFSFSITATDSSANAGPYSSPTQDYTTKIDPPTVLLSPASLPGGKVGTGYDQTVTASGGIAPYTYGVSGTLPAGLTLAANGHLSGTPSTAGTFSFGITATDSTSGPGAPVVASKVYSVTIAAK